MCIEMSRYYGLLTPGQRRERDAKACNLQAGAEGMMTGLACAMAGCDVLLAFGIIDSAQTASIAKTVLDADTVNAIERFLRDDPVDDAQALLDDIAEVGIGGHYLGRKSTRTVLPRRRALAAGRLAATAVRELRRGGRSCEDAVARGEELIAGNDVPPLPDDVAKHCDELIAGYLRSLG